jgi:hypothetical protein
MDLPLSRREIARIGAVLHLFSGLVTLLSLLLPAPRGLNVAGVVAVAVAAMLIGAIIWALPWQRWPRQATLAIACDALLLVAAHNYFGGADPYRVSMFFIVLFTWLGLSQPRGTSLVLSPLLGSPTSRRCSSRSTRRRRSTRPPTSCRSA